MTLDVSGSDDLGCARQEEHGDVRIKGRKVSNQHGPINDHDAPYGYSHMDMHAGRNQGGVPSEHEHACKHDECWEPIVPTSPPCKFPLSFVPRSFSIMLAPSLLPRPTSMISHINATTVIYGSWLCHLMDADVGACDEPLLEGGAPS